MALLFQRFAIGLFCLTLATQAQAQYTPPSFKSGVVYIIITPSFETNLAGTNLSITGLNHSLLFGQMLNTYTAGQTIQNIYSFYNSNATGSTSQDMTALESIEPYALLNMLSISPNSLITTTGASAITTTIENILNNSESGIYIISLPTSSFASFCQDNKINCSGLSSQYIVATYSSSTPSFELYNDGIPQNTNFPTLTLSQAMTTQTCQQPSVTLKLNAPPSPAYTLNANQTVYFVRHVEAHPNGLENGNYVCQGQWRALAAPPILNKLMGGKATSILTTNMTGQIANANDVEFPYIRPALSVAPYAIQNDLAPTLAPFAWSDPDSLATTLFTQNSQTSSPTETTILVSWEHTRIVDAVNYLIQTIYQGSGTLPTWSGSDYDSVWVLSSDSKGNLTFSNTCEGIVTSALPNICPAFPITAN